MSALQPVCDLVDAIAALRKDEAAGSVQVCELKDMDYERDGEYGSLHYGNVTYSLNDWSAKQLCRIAGMPFGVWSKVSGPLAKDLTREMVLAVKNQQRKLVLRTYGKKTVIRGILPVDYPDIKNSDILEGLRSRINIPYVVQSAKWLDSTSQPLLRTRIVFTDPDYTMKVGDETLFLSLDITSSEVGGGLFAVNLLLYQLICANGAIATYGKKPYFAYNYAPGISFDVPAIMGEAVDRASLDAPRLATCVKDAMAQVMDNDRAKLVLLEMQKNNTLNKGVVIKAISLIDGNKKAITSLWDLVSMITEISQSYRDELRLRYETIAGSLLGMQFNRRANRPEETYAEKMPMLALPPAFVQ